MASMLFRFSKSWQDWHGAFLDICHRPSLATLPNPEHRIYVSSILPPSLDPRCSSFGHPVNNQPVHGCAGVLSQPGIVQVHIRTMTEKEDSACNALKQLSMVAEQAAEDATSEQTHHALQLKAAASIGPSPTGNPTTSAFRSDSHTQGFAKASCGLRFGSRLCWPRVIA